MQSYTYSSIKKSAYFSKTVNVEHFQNKTIYLLFHEINFSDKKIFFLEKISPHFC